MWNIVTYVNEECKQQIKYVTVNEEIFFKAKDIATILGYVNTKKAIRDHVDDEDKKNTAEIITLHGSLKCTMDDTALSATDNSLWINESGLYALIFGSNKPYAKEFKRWVTNEVLPSIRKNGTYTMNNISNVAQNKQLKCNNETDLHYNVVKFIKRYIPDAVLCPTLGELQDTSEKRIDAYNKGYQSGSPDLIINNFHKKFRGLAIEFKTPTGEGVLSDKQKETLEKYAVMGFKILISNDYNEIIYEIMKYFEDVRVICLHCNRKFKTIESLIKHVKIVHKTS